MFKICPNVLCVSLQAYIVSFQPKILNIRTYMGEIIRSHISENCVNMIYYERDVRDKIHHNKNSLFSKLTRQDMNNQLMQSRA